MFSSNLKRTHVDTTQVLAVMVALQSIHLLLLFVLLRNGNSQTCSFMYIQQPPTMLDCDPLGISITLQCATESSSHNVTWYWTQNVSEAGVSGTAIFPGDTGDNYQVSDFGTNIRRIFFTVSESTLGYYWCEISNAVNASLRPSTITPVCLPMSSSQQNKCNRSHILDLHHDVTECAEVYSPTVISRPFLPISCAGSPTSLKTPSVAAMTTSAAAMIPSAATMTRSAATMTPSVATMSHSAAATMTCPTNTVVCSKDQTSTTIPLVVLLVVVSVILLVSVSLNIALCYRVQRPTETNEECVTQKSIFQVEQQHSDAGEPEEMTPNVAYTSFLMSSRSGKQEEVEYEAVGL